MKVVIDTNLFVSAAINANSRQRLELALYNDALSILLDEALLSEFVEVINRPKFRRYISANQIIAFIDLIERRSTFVTTTSTVDASPDPKDNFLLALCMDNQADFLLTGNKRDLLDLKQFGKTKILTLTDFLKLFPG
ncbi:putative toxin-antitoxin system toxin component, PIN family [Persicitalea jodogahamensis]|uniref:PIN domain-containing protein n=1 Tax=Persicitalea jodogahamensis TaxID=402147 RepID=A0A8J3GBM0_9BACT|nr:putative toxin-antitoxin system toxin component, PIN family [Persicitalea jodogahamensis]GHB87737.1 PIN domain-containing protein [Persicitalea jodogahamensis]